MANELAHVRRVALFGLALSAPLLHSQKQIAAVNFSVPDLSKLSDGERALAVHRIALKIRTSSGCAQKAVTTSELMDAADDVPDKVLAEVAATYAEALRGCPGEFENAYLQLARLLRGSHIPPPPGDPRLSAALEKVDAENREIEEADFTLADIQGKSWTLSKLRGKVVLLNFWFTGCPPCVHEVPALNTLYDRFRSDGLVILAIAGDDDVAALRSFLASHSVAYPVLLASGRKITERFHVVAVPRTMVFDRSGKLTGQVIGARTKEQFAEMLAQAGLR